MSTKHSPLDVIFATPTRARGAPVSISIRSSLLSTLFDNFRPLIMASLASAFVALVAFSRLHQGWAVLWFVAEVCVSSARLAMVRAYTSRSHSGTVHPRRWATFYGPLALASSLLLGAGTMACVMARETRC